MSDITQILRDLAAGRITTAEADRLIADEQASKAAESATADQNQQPAESPTQESTTQESTTQARPSIVSGPDAATGPAGVERVQVRTVGRRVRLIGDRGVATLSADGPHTLRRVGPLLEVSSDGEFGPALDAFTMLRSPSLLDDLRALGRTGLGSLGLGNVGFGQELVLHVNPALGVDVEITAGSLSVRGLPRLGKVRITAAGAALHDVSEVKDALLQAGSLSLEGCLVSGRSRVRVESGQLSVDLDPQSDVTVHAEAQMGRVSWPDETQGIDEYVLGQGTARLDVGVVMGYASVRIGGAEANDRSADAGDETDGSVDEGEEP